MNAGAIAGIAVGVVVVILLLTHVVIDSMYPHPPGPKATLRTMYTKVFRNLTMTHNQKQAEMRRIMAANEANSTLQTRRSKYSKQNERNKKKTTPAPPESVLHQ